MNEEIEKWKKYDSNYVVSNMGRVGSLRKNKIIIPIENRFGYLMVCINGRLIGVHRLVAECFLEKENENQIYVDHINTKRDDNRAMNLRWVSPFENMHNEITEHRFTSEPIPKECYEQLGLSYYEVPAFRKNRSKDGLESFLKENYREKTRFVTKDDKDFVRKYFVFSDKRGRKVKGSAKLINSYLEEINCEYRLEEKKTTKDGKNIRYWQVGLK